MIAELREQIAESEPALEVEFVGIVPDVIGDLQGNPEPIEVKLFSEDAAALQAKADEVEAAIKKSSRRGRHDQRRGYQWPGDHFQGRSVASVAIRRDGRRRREDCGTTAMSGDAASFNLATGPIDQSARDLSGGRAHVARQGESACRFVLPIGQFFRLDQVADVEYERDRPRSSARTCARRLLSLGGLKASDLGTAISQIHESTGEGSEAAAGNDGRVWRTLPGATVEFSRVDDCARSRGAAGLHHSTDRVSIVCASDRDRDRRRAGVVAACCWRCSLPARRSMWFR